MKERPILFSGPMVRAILEGRKTQTRRVMNPQPTQWTTDEHGFIWPAIPTRIGGETVCGLMQCRHGMKGDILWVKETWREGSDGIEYRADDEDPTLLKWKSPLFMPRKYSRITLEIVNVRVKRVQDISDDDAKAEGLRASWLIYRTGDAEHNARRTAIYEKYGRAVADTHEANERDEFAYLWDSINEKRGFGWDVNPFVWCILFQRQGRV